MTEIPPAIVKGPRPAHRPTPAAANALRKLAAVAIILGALFACCKMLNTSTRSESNKQLEARQAKARDRVGTAFDKLFEELLETDSTSITLEANLTVAPELGSGYDAHNCGWGFDDAFKEALGENVLTVSSSGVGRSPATLSITAKITPSGMQFQLPRSNKSYPGIAMTADLKFLGKDVHAEVQPASEIEFKHYNFGISFEGVSADDVAGGVLQGTCKQAGYALLEAVTKWKRPSPPARADPVAECERGFRCRENAELLEETDRAAAAKLFAKACDQDDDDACVRGAALEMELSRGIDEHGARGRMMLEMACHRELVASCAAAGRARLRPLEEGKPPSDYQRGEALLMFLRACDLGARDACEEAAPLLAGTPLAEAAPLLTGAATAKSKTLGTMFALRWGQWTEWDSGQPTVWVTKEPPRPPDGAIVRQFELDKLPAGITAPAGATAVFAIALQRGRGGTDNQCGTCMPSGGGDTIYSMRSMRCVCALAPKKQR